MKTLTPLRRWVAPRLSNCRQDVHNFWFKEVPAILVIVCVAVFGAMYAVIKFVLHAPFDSNWQIVSLGMAFVISSFLIAMGYPEHPSEGIEQAASRRRAKMSRRRYSSKP